MSCVERIQHERDLARRIAEEAMKMLTDEQLVQLRSILDEAGENGDPDDAS